MKILFNTEWLRIKKQMWWVAAIHLIGLLFLVNFDLIFSTSIGFKISQVLIYGIGGLLFAVIQIRQYKEAGHWIYLLNRPLSEKNAFLALLLAALKGFFVGVVLPFAVVTLAIDFYSVQQVDWRHYWQLLYLLGVVLSCYLTGCFLLLSRSRWYALVLILPILTVMSLNLGGRVFILQLLVIALLLPLVLLVFKINSDELPKGSWLVLILALVIQWCAFKSVTVMINVVELSVAEIEYINKQSSQTETTYYPDSFNPLTYLDNKQKILAGLSDLDAGLIKKYIAETALNDAFRIRKRIGFQPTRQQIQWMDERMLVLIDEASDIEWVFSHDEMLFVGHNSVTLEHIGFLGPTKNSLNLSGFDRQERFTTVPWIIGDQFVVGNQLFRFDPITQLVTNVFSATAGEYLLNVLQQQGNINTIISNQALYVFDGIEVDKNQFPLEPVISLDLPGDYNNLWDISVIEVKDKFLLSFLYGKDPRKDFYVAEQLTYEFNLQGEIKWVATRPIQHDSGIFMRNLDYLISPFWKVLSERFPVLPGRDRYLTEHRWPKAPPLSIILAIAVLAFAGFLTTFYWAKQRQLKVSQQWLWSLTTAVTLVPGLISFLLLHQKPQKLTITATRTAQDPSASKEMNHV